MRIVLAFNGTRGDIQPAVVLGVELAARGHDVVFGAPPNLVDFVARAGLAVRSFGYDTRAHMNSEVVREGVRTGGPRARLRALREIRDRGWDQMVDEMFGLCDGADVILTGFTTEQIAFAFAERDGIPLVVLHHAPIVENPHVSPFPGAPLNLPARVNLLSWKLVDSVFWLLTRARENRLRTRLGMPVARRRLSARMADAEVTAIQAYDRVFCPEFADLWDERRPLVGFVDLPAGLRARIGAEVADPALDEWFLRGEEPVYFGFGSIPVRDCAGALAAIEAACRALGVRALVCAGWSDLDRATPEAGSAGRYDTDDFRIVTSVDHHQVFRRCRAVVHHGGAGTTSAAVRAGKPAVVCWVGSDQPFWGRRLERLGVGASTGLKGLTAQTLEQKLRVVLEPEFTARARELAVELVPSAAAVTAAVDVLERLAGRATREELTA